MERSYPKLGDVVLFKDDNGMWREAEYMGANGDGTAMVSGLAVRGFVQNIPLSRIRRINPFSMRERRRGARGIA